MQEFHDVNHIAVRKDGFIPSKPWCADVIWKDGDVWTSWSYGYRTRKALLAHIEAIAPTVTVKFE
ncbi:MAG: hypothetical protein ACR2RF_25275 [Geminicoccaceae bacterium]